MRVVVEEREEEGEGVLEMLRRTDLVKVRMEEIEAAPDILVVSMGVVESVVVPLTLPPLLRVPLPSPLLAVVLPLREGEGEALSKTPVAVGASPVRLKREVGEAKEGEGAKRDSLETKEAVGSKGEEVISGVGVTVGLRDAKGSKVYSGEMETLGLCEPPMEEDEKGVKVGGFEGRGVGEPVSDESGEAVLKGEVEEVEEDTPSKLAVGPLLPQPPLPVMDVVLEKRVVWVGTKGVTLPPPLLLALSLVVGGPKLGEVVRVGGMLVPVPPPPSPPPPPPDPVAEALSQVEREGEGEEDLVPPASEREIEGDRVVEIDPEPEGLWLGLRV